MYAAPVNKANVKVRNNIMIYSFPKLWRTKYYSASFILLLQPAILIKNARTFLSQLTYQLT